MEIEDQEIKVRDISEDWALALMERGIIVRLHISRWRAVAPLKYDELGIAFSDSDAVDFMKKYISLGHEKLLPPSVMWEISNLERKARTCLRNHSFDTNWGKFIPYASFLNWKEENDAIKEEFYEFSRRMGVNYDDIIREVQAQYRKMGEDVWKRLYPKDTKPPSESFLTNFVTKITDKIPAREEIVSSFKYSETYFNIPLPSIIQKDLANTQKIVEDMETSAVEHFLELESKRVIAAEYQSKKKEMVESFLDSTVAYLRQHVRELVTNTYYILQKNEKDISLVHIKKLKRAITQIRKINFYDDHEVESLLSELEIEVGKYKGERDKSIISTKLKQLIDLADEQFTPEVHSSTIDLGDFQ